MLVDLFDSDVLSREGLAEIDYLPHLDCAALVRKARIARDDRKALEPAERTDVLDHAVGEIVLF